MAEMGALTRGRRPRVEDGDGDEVTTVAEKSCRSPRNGVAPPDVREISVHTRSVIYMHFWRC